MNKVNLKKALPAILILVGGCYIVYSFYIQLEYRNLISRSVKNNASYLSFISATGNNLASRLEAFIQLPIEQEEQSEVKSELYDNWRIVHGESKSIFSYLISISTLHLGKKEQYNWNLLQYSLLRVDGFIAGMTYKFLEHYSYAISKEEKEKMEAIVSIFRSIHTEIQSGSRDLDIILEAIREPMLVVDEYYQSILDQIDK